MDYEYIVIFVTASSIEEAQKIGKELVEQRLAACCNVIPGLQSIYRWEGKVQEDSETMLIIKTKKVIQDKVIEKIYELHSYKLPETISLPITGSTEKYFKWLDESIDT